MTLSLKDHLNKETLPSPDNYNPHLLTIGSRATLDELHLGEVDDQKVSNKIKMISCESITVKLSA
jgi:solute carrier family 12 sodium/potassium/chloride transporter 2